MHPNLSETANPIKLTGNFPEKGPECEKKASHSEHVGLATGLLNTQ